MAQSRAALAALIAANIADNTSEAITPALHRAVEDALSDSCVNWVDDVKTTLNNNNNEVPTSGAIASIIGTTSLKKVPQNFTVDLSAAELASGNAKQILPAVAGHYWSVLDCQVKVNWNTTGFDTPANIRVLNEGAATYMYELKDLDTLGAGSAIFRAVINTTGSVTNGAQYIANTRLVAQCANPPTAGDGTVKVYITAQLVEA